MFLDVNILWMFLGSSLVVLMQAQALRLAKTNRELAESESLLRGRNAQLDDANERLRELGLVKSQLLTNVEYEVLPPVRTIVSAADLIIRQEDAGPLARQCASTIVTECERLSRIMGTLPTTSEREQRGLWWLESRVDVPGVIESAVSCLRSTAERVGVRIDCEVDAELPSVWVDHDRLAHVLTQLIDNAVLFSAARGSVAVTAKRSGPEVLIAIAQCGGSSRPFTTEIFGSSNGRESAGSLSAENNNGQNIGLRMCREVVEDRHGRIWVEQHESGGTIYKVAFPASQYEGKDADYTGPMSGGLPQ